MNVSLADLESAVPQFRADLFEAIAADARSLVVAAGNRFQADSPVQSGTARISVSGWIGTQPSGGWSPKGRRRRVRGGSGPKRATGFHKTSTREDESQAARTHHGPSYGATGGDFAAVVAEWNLAQPAGLTMTVPYAHKLSSGESPQQAKGWVPALLHDVVTEHREARA